jgi:hypothetical protein
MFVFLCSCTCIDIDTALERGAVAQNPKSGEVLSLTHLLVTATINVLYI